MIPNFDDYYDWDDDDDYEDNEYEGICMYDFGFPDLVDEYCNFMCPAHEACFKFFDSFPDCVKKHGLPTCGTWHEGKCLGLLPDNESRTARLWAWLRRQKCRITVKEDL